MGNAADFEELTPSDRTALAAALGAAGLPASDIDEPGRRFWRLRAEGKTVGFAGLEPYGTDALLRSVVVVDGRRRRGAGSALVGKVAKTAASLGVKRLWLLTTTAPDFFRRLGFRPVDRAAAPPAIARSTEFAEICPASAVCMVLELDSTPTPIR